MRADIDYDNMSSLEIWLSDLSEDSATRVAAAVLIISGSLLGTIFGVLAISANPAEILSGSLVADDDYADINGIVNSALINNNTGGEPIEGVKLTLLNVDGTVTGKETFTDQSGRFQIQEVPRQSFILFASLEDNISVRLFMIPGDHSQIPITMMPGDDELVTEIDWRGESDLNQAATLATIIAILTLISGLFGIRGGYEVLYGKSYKKAWWFSFIGLWSRGGLFIGPLLILIGMALSGLTKHQFMTDEINIE
ncbi:MAG: carboxypeptidase-like regulatory domain-containing protein [Candidatus Thalassarchaeaceae archaeon]